MASSNSPTIVPALSARDSYAVTAIADITDRSLHAAPARFTAGLSPAALAARLSGLGDASCQRAGQAAAARRQGGAQGGPLRQLCRPRCAWAADNAECCIEPLPQDRRFAGEAWQHGPTTLIHQAFLLQAAMVAQRDHRRARRFAAAREHRRVRRRARSSTWSRRRTSC